MRRAVVDGVRGLALAAQREQINLALELDLEDPLLDKIADFGLSTIDGAFVAAPADRPAALGRILDSVIS